jgi:hypothetical protein
MEGRKSRCKECGGSGYVIMGATVHYCKSVEAVTPPTTKRKAKLPSAEAASSLTMEKKKRIAGGVEEAVFVSMMETRVHVSNASESKVY